MFFIFFSKLMILTFIFLLQIFTFTLLFLIPAINKNLIQFVGFSSSCIVLILSCILLVLFNSDLYYFQHIVTYELDSTLLNLSFSFGLDGISIYFFVLSSFLIFLCTAFVWKSRLLKEYYISLNLISFLLLIIFSCLDLLAFYVFFEAILIPMYLLIGLWGSRERKIRAVYLFFFYTLVGSLLMLIGILYIYSKFCTFNL
jgi:NADH:ubiquinone oxidoreductase subunit 4 (subunit M)